MLIYLFFDFGEKIINGQSEMLISPNTTIQTLIQSGFYEFWLFYFERKNKND